SEDAKRNVDGHAHVGRKEDGRLPRQFRHVLLLGSGESSRADHRTPAGASDDSQVGETRFGDGELDEDAIPFQHLLGVRREGKSKPANARDFTGVPSERWMGRRLERRYQRETWFVL